MTLKLTLTVDYEAEDASEGELKDRLRQIVRAADGMGSFTDDTSAYVKDYDYHVERIK